MTVFEKAWAFLGFFYLGALFLAIINYFLKGRKKRIFRWFIAFHLVILCGFFALQSITFRLGDFPSSIRRFREDLVAKEMPYEGFQPELLRKADEIIPESAAVIIWKPTGAFDLYRASYFLYPRVVYDTKIRQSGDYLVSFLHFPREATPSADLVFSAENIGFIYKVTRPNQPYIE